MKKTKFTNVKKTTNDVKFTTVKKFGKDTKKTTRIVVPFSRNSAELASFVSYCVDNPQERIFQAMRNWIGCGFLRADDVDTFHCETLDDLRERLNG